jgi:hypothetical protein
MKVSEYLPDGTKRRRVPLEDILVIEDPVLKKVEKVLDREFTEEQEKTIKALLFFLKREVLQEISFSSIKEFIENKHINILFMKKNEQQVGFMLLDDTGSDSRSCFSGDNHLDLKEMAGLGILFYIKMAIYASIKKIEMKSDLYHLTEKEAKVVWRRLEHLGLSFSEGMDCWKFKDISFLSEKDFEDINEILKKENPT